MSAQQINPITYSRQMAEPGFEPRSLQCPSKYCNHLATEADWSLRCANNLDQHMNSISVAFDLLP